MKIRIKLIANAFASMGTLEFAQNWTILFDGNIDLSILIGILTTWGGCGELSFSYLEKSL